MESELSTRQPLGRGLEIYVSPRHTFGSDAVLLAHFAAAKKTDRLVDLGTGCGIIPFLMLRDGLLQNAVGVDISGEAISLARRSEELAATGRFTALHADLKSLPASIGFGSHTLVTCNPPYKAPNGGLKSTDPERAAARHETMCTLGDIMSVSSRLLQTGGRLCICQRPERLCELTALMSEQGVEPKRLRIVCQRTGLEPWLVLVEGKKGAKTGLRIAPPLYVEENGGLSEEMLEIYGCYKEAGM